MHKRFLSFITLAFSSFLMAGCAAVVVGAIAAVGTYAYMDGWLERDYKASVDQVYSASLGACSQLGMTVTEKEKRVAGAEIKAKDGSTTVWIDIDAEEDGYTTVAIRYGVAGDEEASRRIHEAIHSRL